MNQSARERRQAQTERAKGSDTTKSLASKRTGTLELASCIHRGEIVGMIPCNCGSGPAIHQCNHPDATTKLCTRFLEAGQRRCNIEQSGVAVCELCQIRVRDPNKFDSVQEWRDAKKETGLPSSVTISLVG